MNIDWSKKKTAAEVAAEATADEQARINAEARAYLASTDWYVTRQQETGAPIPDVVLTERAAARLRVIE